MNDEHDNRQDDRAIAEKLGLDTGLRWKFSPVKVEHVYQISCQLCQAGNVEDTYEEYGDAEDAAEFHLKVHQGKV